jgi:3',5'-cyclic AMP phosphodiesterase CpdA
MRFLHCSDVHVTQNYFAAPLLKLGWRRWIALFELELGGRAKAYSMAKQTLSRIVADARAHRVDHVILSGDLTAYAMEAEFQGAREALGELADDPRRLTVIPGNHDVYTPGAKSSRRFERYFGHLIVSDLPQYAGPDGFPFVRLVGDTAVVGLASARVPEVPGFSFGVIGESQRSRLAQLLEDPELKDRAVLVVVHHAPLGEHGRADKILHGLWDAKKLFELCHGPKFAVLHGHIHKRYHHPASDTQPHLFGAGSSTQAGHEGYWIIETEAGRIAGAQMHPVGDPSFPAEQAAHG